jgi:hypothetical protein
MPTPLHHMYFDNVKFRAKCHCEERSDEAISTVACN